MSIYPVKINDWYNKKGSVFYEEREMLKIMMPLKCCVCKKEFDFPNGYVMHSITFGGPDGAWCSKKCLNRERISVLEKNNKHG